MTIIETHSLVKIYKSPFLLRESYGLKGLDLEVNKGDIFGLLGPNGAGKTTAMKILVGLIKPTSGTVKLFGGDNIREARERIGFLPENPEFYQHLSGMELLGLFRRLYGKEVSREYLQEKLKMVGLNNYRNMRISTYSRGMIQRLGFAQALIGEPELLILDEPLSGLDPLGRRELKDLIHKVSDNGVTVLFSSHILSDVEAICDRVGIIIEGRMKKVGYIRDIIDSDIKYIEVEIKGMKDCQSLEEYGTLKIEGDFAYLRITDENLLDIIIEEIMEKNGDIISITPHRKSLEEHFIKTIDV